MSLTRLIDVLGDAGLDLDAEAVLDALWLARFNPTLDTTPNPALLAPPSRPVMPQVEKRTSASALPSGESPAPPSLPRPEPPGSVDVIASAHLGGQGRRASPFAVAAARSLPDRLAFLRALRPFQQRFPSARNLEVDEEATAHLSADLKLAGYTSLFPVFRPTSERWFEVELISEDDDAIALWEDELRALAQIMRDTGAFRNVREWRLRLSSSQGRAELVSPSGFRAPTNVLHGAERRLVIFASHASSRYWSTGAYPRLLTGWGRDSAVALLHLLPRRAWTRTPLGDTRGIASTVRPGASNVTLDVQVDRWAIDPTQLIQPTPFPMVELSPDAVANWAKMLMARGRSTPVTMLSSEPWDTVSEEPPLADLDVLTAERRVMGLRQSAPAAFELAALLTTGPFTIPVARLIQEALFGRSDRSQLAELFLSGVVRSLRAGNGDAAEGWFEHWPAAAALLRRSLRSEDADALAATIVARVSQHLEALKGRQVRMSSFTPDDQGQYALQDWAVPFARVASGLRREPLRKRTAAEVIQALSAVCSARELARAARAAEADAVINRRDYSDSSWSFLFDTLVTTVSDRRRTFTAEARNALRKINAAKPLLGVRILWVDDRPTNNARYSQRLETEGAKVDESLSTRHGLARLSKAKYDVVITDMARDEGDREGLVLLKAIRQRHKRLPVIIFSAAYPSVAVNRHEAWAAGAFSCTNNFESVHTDILTLVRNPDAAPPMPLPDAGEGFDGEGASRSRTERVVEIQVPSKRRGGLGYLISARYVLTAAHLVEETADIRCRVQGLSGRRERVEFAGRRIWSDRAIDAAVIELETDVPGGDGENLVGELSIDGSWSLELITFDRGGGLLRERTRGRWANRSAGQLLCERHERLPVSGAALCLGNTLVGIVTNRSKERFGGVAATHALRQFEQATFTAEPVERASDSPTLRSLLQQLPSLGRRPQIVDILEGVEDDRYVHIIPCVPADLPDHFATAMRYEHHKPFFETYGNLYFLRPGPVASLIAQIADNNNEAGKRPETLVEAIGALQSSSVNWMFLRPGASEVDIGATEELVGAWTAAAQGAGEYVAFPILLLFVDQEDDESAPRSSRKIPAVQALIRRLTAAGRTHQVFPLRQISGSDIVHWLRGLDAPRLDKETHDRLMDWANRLGSRDLYLSNVRDELRRVLGSQP